MELVLNNLQYGYGESNLIEKYWQGGIRPWASLELVSIEGHIHFIVRIPKGGESVFESQVYAHYPDVEIFEVPDYTLNVDFTADEKIKLWGTEFKLEKPDPYPIKTYIDYGLDKDPKEELKIDPIAPTIEWLGSLGKGEQGWMQILVRLHKKENKAPGLLGYLGIKKTDRWKDDVKSEIEKILDDRKIKGDDVEERAIKLTRGEEDAITALERSITKPAFDVGLRVIYIAESDVFNPANIGGALGSVKQYNSSNLNGFKGNSKYKTGFDAAYWQDPTGIRARARKRNILDAYKRRSYFHPPYKRPHFILNSEELATIYHFPGSVLTTPTVKRLESRKAEPPTDLPL